MWVCLSVFFGGGVRWSCVRECNWHFNRDDRIHRSDSDCRVKPLIDKKSDVRGMLSLPGLVLCKSCFVCCCETSLSPRTKPQFYSMQEWPRHPGPHMSLPEPEPERLWALLKAGHCMFYVPASLFPPTRVPQLRSCLNLGINAIILLWLVLGFVTATGDLSQLPLFPWSSRSEQLRPPMWTGRHSSALGWSKQARHTDPEADRWRWTLDAENISHIIIELQLLKLEKSKIMFLCTNTSNNK